MEAPGLGWPLGWLLGLAEITSPIHIVPDPGSSADTGLTNEEMPDLDNLDIS